MSNSKKKFGVRLEHDGGMGFKEPKKIVKRFNRHSTIMRLSVIIFVFIVPVSAIVLTIFSEYTLQQSIWEIIGAALISFYFYNIRFEKLYREIFKNLNAKCDLALDYELLVAFQQSGNKDVRKNTFPYLVIYLYINSEHEKARNRWNQYDQMYSKRKKIDTDFFIQYLFAIKDKDTEIMNNCYNQLSSAWSQKKKRRELWKGVQVYKFVYEEKYQEAMNVIFTMRSTSAFGRVFDNINLGKCFYYLGNYEEAKKHLNLVIAEGNTLPQVKEAQVLIDACNNKLT